MRFPHFGIRTRPIETVVVSLLLLIQTSVVGVARDTLPASLTDGEFWSLTEKISEPDGYFRSNSGSPDNLLSNENSISTVAAALADRAKPAGVYLGVGPEQNFTYIAAMRPRMAFVIDIRRGNLQLHLLYKALFEMSADRVEFVGRLFSRESPVPELFKPGTTKSLTASALMNAYLTQPAVDEATYKANLKAIIDHLTRTRSFPLSEDDRAGIDYVYRHFHRFGPAIHYTSSINGSSNSMGSYARIQAMRDAVSGAERTYLASEASFELVKSLQKKNLIVPIVGDFGGPKALRAIGAFIRERGAILNAFYVSNVEGYLQRNGVWQTFCTNVATMPLDGSSVFIRPSSGPSTMFGGMQAETLNCRAEGERRSRVPPRRR